MGVMRTWDLSRLMIECRTDTSLIGREWVRSERNLWNLDEYLTSPLNRPLPPPVPGTAALVTVRTDPVPVVRTLPVVAAVGAIGVLTTSLVASKYLLDAIVGFGWPVVVYVALLVVAAYGPSVWWCRFASRRWGTGDLGTDIGLRPQWSDLGWGPVVWLGALGAQIAAGSVVVALDLPISNNTDPIREVAADRVYVVALVIAAVVAAPIVEEMVFRGVVLRGLSSRMPIVLAIVLQGVLFGAAHIDPVRGAGNIGLVSVLSGVGIAFGIAAHLLRRIGPTIVAHALFNGAVLIVVLTGVADRLQDAAAEQVHVVDQAHVTDSDRNGQSVVTRSAPIGTEVGHLGEAVGVEHTHVVDRRHRFRRDHP
jgi:membrane protease YdiL (CAAX protease family)